MSRQSTVADAKGFATSRSLLRSAAEANGDGLSAVVAVTHPSTTSTLPLVSTITFSKPQISEPSETIYTEYGDQFNVYDGRNQFQLKITPENISSFSTLDVVAEYMAGRINDANYGGIMAFSDRNVLTILNRYLIPYRHTPTAQADRNQAPVLATSLQTIQCAEGSRLRLQVSGDIFRDGDGDPLRLSFQLVSGGSTRPLPAWLQVAQGAVTISGPSNGSVSPTAVDASFGTAGDNFHTLTGVVPANTPDLTIRVFANDGNWGIGSADFRILTPARATRRESHGKDGAEAVAAVLNQSQNTRPLAAASSGAGVTPAVSAAGLLAAVT